MAREDHESIEASLLDQLREEIHRRLAPHRHSAILVARLVGMQMSQSPSQH